MKMQRMLVGVLMVVAFLTCFALGMAHAQVPGVVPDLSDWANNTWFKVKLTRTVYHFSNIGVKPTPSYTLPQSMGTAYLRITNWDATTPGAEFLTASVYAKDPDTGQWVSTPFATFDINYFAGSDLKFIGSGQLLTPDDVTMNLVFVFTGQRNKAGNFALGGITNLSTIGSSMLEIDDAPGSTERWAGSAKISGPMVPASSVPFVPAP
jgi:hypothetical protein